MKQLLITSLLLLSSVANASETLIQPGSPGNASGADQMYLVLSNGKTVPAIVTYTSDGSGNLIPISGGGGGGTTPSDGRVALAHVRNAYASTNVTTAAYVQLVASTSGIVNEVEIFDSSGQTLVIAFGAAASEVDKVYVTPGGNGRIPLLIPAATRVSIKAVTATASVGEIDINFYQ